MANLKAATALYLGGTAINRVYYGTSQLWPAGASVPLVMTRVGTEDYFVSQPRAVTFTTRQKAFDIGPAESGKRIWVLAVQVGAVSALSMSIVGEGNFTLQESHNVLTPYMTLHTYDTDTLGGTITIKASPSDGLEYAYSVWTTVGHTGYTVDSLSGSTGSNAHVVTERTDSKLIGASLNSNGDASVWTPNVGFFSEDIRSNEYASFMDDSGDSNDAASYSIGGSAADISSMVVTIYGPSTGGGLDVGTLQRLGSEDFYIQGQPYASTFVTLTQDLNVGPATVGKRLWLLFYSVAGLNLPTSIAVQGVGNFTLQESTTPSPTCALYTFDSDTLAGDVTIEVTPQDGLEYAWYAWSTTDHVSYTVSSDTTTSGVNCSITANVPEGSSIIAIAGNNNGGEITFVNGGSVLENADIRSNDWFTAMDVLYAVGDATYNIQTNSDVAGNNQLFVVNILR